MFKEQAPKYVYPADNDPKDSNEDSDDVLYKATAMQGVAPSYEDFRNPVNAGNE